MIVGVEEAKGQREGIRGDEGLFTPVRTRARLDQRFLVAYGFGRLEQKVGVFNPVEAQEGVERRSSTRDSILKWL